MKYLSLVCAVLWCVEGVIVLMFPENDWHISLAIISFLQCLFFAVMTWAAFQEGKKDD